MLTEAGIQLSGGRGIQPAFQTVKALMGKQSENDYRKPALKPFQYSAIENPSEFIQRKFGDKDDIKPFDRCAACDRKKADSPELTLWKAVHTPEYWGLRYADMKQEGRWWYTDDGYRFPPIEWNDPKTGKKYWAIAIMGDGWRDTTKLGKDRKKNRYEFLAFRDDNSPDFDSLERFKSDDPSRITIDRVELNGVKLNITNLTLARVVKGKRKEKGAVVVPKDIKETLQEVRDVRKEEREEKKESPRLAIKKIEEKKVEKIEEEKPPVKESRLTKDEEELYKSQLDDYHAELTKNRKYFDSIIEKYQSAKSPEDLIKKFKLYRDSVDNFLILEVGNTESRIERAIEGIYSTEDKLDPPDTELERVNRTIDKLRDLLILKEKEYEEIFLHPNSKWFEGIERRKKVRVETIQELEDEIKPLELLRDSLDITLAKTPFTVSPPKNKIEEVERIYPESDGFRCPIDFKTFLTLQPLKIHLQNRHPDIKFIFEKGERPDDEEDL